MGAKRFPHQGLTSYIRERLEVFAPNVGYETYVQAQRGKNKGLGSWRFVVFSHGGIFLFTQIMAIGIGLAKFSNDVVGWSLLGIDIVAALVVIWLMNQAGGYRAGGYK